MTTWWTGRVWHPSAPVHWRIDQIVAPTADVLDLSLVRDGHLRVTNGTAEDTIIQAYIDAAVDHAETYLQRPLAPRTLKLVLDRFPWENVVELPRPPVIEIISFEYIDSDGHTQTFDSSNYIVSLPSGPKAAPARITLKTGSCWPTTCYAADAVQITYRAGYTDGASPEGANVPTLIKQACLLLVGEFYKQRSVSVSGLSVSAKAVVQAEALLDKYRVY